MAVAMPTGSEIREMFLRYFEQQGHTRVHSSSLVPANDPTLLFTNAGMNQFKDLFLGLEKRGYARACSSQKCVRAGGKHNDLENVGFTNRHHTFFEMLGNFSFGDYFKQDAIHFAWELLTDKKWYGIPKDKLYCTIFKGEGGVGRDDEAEKHWLEVGVPKNRIFEFGMKDNFWQMGDTGPCGPCSEVHYDMGAAASDLGHKDCAFGCDCGRYVELWNLVFMQFDRQYKTIERRKTEGAQDKVEIELKSAQETVLKPLPKPCVDTGMGLERVAAVLQGKISNYDTDLFETLYGIAAQLIFRQTHGRMIVDSSNVAEAGSLRVIADHSRAATFLIADGVLPSNEGRGYVLRKILRRAVRHGRLHGATEPFLSEMVPPVVDLMSDAYPDVRESQARVMQIIKAEEVRFFHTLDIGLKKLDEGLQSAVAAEVERRGLKLRDLKAFDEDVPDIERRRIVLGSAVQQLRGQGVSVTYPGENAFKLYDTYGLPRDFVEDTCRDEGILFDATGFDKAMAEQREKARASWKGDIAFNAQLGFNAALKAEVIRGAYKDLPRTTFVGYEHTGVNDCSVLRIVRPLRVGEELVPESVQELKVGDSGEVILDQTPFYAESGGQVGDVGWLYDPSRNVVAEVRGCYAPVQGVRAHKVVAKQPLVVGDRVTASVNAGVREHTMRNHTATHLLHAALRETLGKHVKQAGSLVAPDHLRFDFSHFTSVADEEMQDIEDLINKEVLGNTKVEVIPDVPIDVAINEYKAMALFGEKYGDKVRVIRIGDFSTELCGGTHTGATGEIGLVKILHEGSVSSGVRRVEAVSGEGSLKHFRRDHELESVVTSLVGRASSSSAGGSQSPAEVLKLELEKKEAEIKRLTKELDRARMKSASASVSASDDQVRVVAGVKVLAQRVENLDRSQMRVLVDNLRQKLGSGVVVLGSAADGKVSLIVGVTKDLAERVPAGKIIGPVAKKVGGSGGGRPDLAEAGGKDPEALDAALAEVYTVVAALLS